MKKSNNINSELTAVKYETKTEGMTIELRDNINNKWALVYKGFVVCKDLSVEYEPSPSNRDDEFIDRSRYGFVEDAFNQYKKYVEKLKIDLKKEIEFLSKESKTKKVIKKDMLSKKCTFCKKGRFVETSLWDDWEGVLHCNKCNKSTKRHT